MTQLTLTQAQAQHIINNGYADIYDAYNKPSIRKVKIYNSLYNELKKDGYNNIVIYGCNCNFFTLYAFKNNKALKITYANTYEYKII